jgi:hypothetical protein
MIKSRSLFLFPPLGQERNGWWFCVLTPINQWKELSTIYNEPYATHQFLNVTSTLIKTLYLSNSPIHITNSSTSSDLYFT